MRQVLLAGYSGRSPAAVAAHASEMRKEGVTVPTSFPVFYNVLPCLMTQGPTLQVLGTSTRPEVEFALFSSGGQVFVTVANDQFDLQMERSFSAELSKNVCQKGLGSQAWPLADVAPHWDRLVLSMHSHGRILQQGGVKDILLPSQLVDLARQSRGLAEDGWMIFSGTLPRLIDHADTMTGLTLTLSDPVLDREIRLELQVRDISATR